LIIDDITMKTRTEPSLKAMPRSGRMKTSDRCVGFITLRGRAQGPKGLDHGGRIGFA
jgi:hypothetical protein